MTFTLNAYYENLSSAELVAKLNDLVIANDLLRVQLDLNEQQLARTAEQLADVAAENKRLKDEIEQRNVLLRETRHEDVP